MGVRSVRNAAAVVRSSNDRRKHNALRSRSRQRRKPRRSGREGVAGVAAAEIAAKNRLRIRALPLRNSSNNNRVHRANRVLPARRRLRVRIRMPRAQRRGRKVTVRNGAGVFGDAGAVVAEDRRALRRRHSERQRLSRGDAGTRRKTATLPRSRSASVPSRRSEIRICPESRPARSASRRRRSCRSSISDPRAGRSGRELRWPRAGATLHRR